MPLFTDEDGHQWRGPTRDDSPVAQQMAARLLEEEGAEAEKLKDCFICKVFFEQEAPAVTHSLVDTFKDGMEAIFTIATCAPHTGRWKHTPKMVIHDGQTQRWN